MKRVFSLLLCIVLLCTLLGCDGGYKADMGFVYILPQSISTLDPQTATGSGEGSVIDSIFEGLCRIDNEGNVTPGVARKWEGNSENTQFTFHLRRDAKWSDGTPVTADDFLFGILRALTPETNTPAVDDMFVIQNARSVYSGEAEPDSLGVIAEDDHTLIVMLEESYPDFPALTAGIHYMPCSRAYFEQSAGHYGLSSQYIITNGPFTMASYYAWNTDSGSRSISLVRSNYYKGERSVTPESLKYLIDYDSSIDSDPIAALQAGTVDILIQPEAVARQAEAEGCPVLSLDDAITGLLLNPQADALELTAMRELFIKTLDREDLLSRHASQAESSLEAMGIMPDCVRWSGEPYYVEGDAIYAAQDDGVLGNIPSILSTTKRSSIPNITVICPDDEDSINVVNGMLVAWNNKLGASFNMNPLSDSEFQSRLRSGDYEAALYTFRAGGTTPLEVFRAFESTSTPMLMDSPEFDQALKGSDFSFSGSRELELMIQENYVFYPLFRDNTYFVTSPNVRGITVSPDMGVSFSQARKKP